MNASINEKKLKECYWRDMDEKQKVHHANQFKHINDAMNKGIGSSRKFNGLKK